MSEILALAFVGISVITVLKTLGYKGVGVSAAIILICLFSSLLLRISNLTDGIFSMVSGEVLLLSRDLFKILGLTYLSSIAASTCTSFGENEIAKVVEVWGRVEIIAILLPYFAEILEFGGGLY